MLVPSGPSTEPAQTIWSTGPPFIDLTLQSTVFAQVLRIVEQYGSLPDGEHRGLCHLADMLGAAGYCCSIRESLGGGKKCPVSL